MANRYRSYLNSLEDLKKVILEFNTTPSTFLVPFQAKTVPLSRFCFSRWYHLRLPNPLPGERSTILVDPRDRNCARVLCLRVLCLGGVVFLVAGHPFFLFAVRSQLAPRGPEKRPCSRGTNMLEPFLYSL